MPNNVIVGSGSRRKVDAVVSALRKVAPRMANRVIWYDAPSGVPETPWDEEIIGGAQNRASECERSVPDAVAWIGLETGLVERYGVIYEETWCCLRLDASGWEGLLPIIRDSKDDARVPARRSGSPNWMDTLPKTPAPSRQHVFLGYSSGLAVPVWVLEKMQMLGLSHCDAMAVIERELGLPNDTWGTYTNHILSRQTALEEAARNTFASVFCGGPSVEILGTNAG